LASVVLLAASIATGSIVAAALALAAVAAMAFYVLGGLASARAPVRLWLALALAPAYAFWKGWLYAQALVARGAPSWTRAGRAGEASPGDRI
jgi:hypothetical protein